MPLSIGIVGLPNVGKSTLFNRICRKRKAIVDFEEGVTRDRKYEEAEWSGNTFILVDTGGIIPKSVDKIDKAVKFQAEIAIEESDLILFLVDAKVGTTDMDMEVAKILSGHREKVMLVANKVENEEVFTRVLPEIYSLGFGDPLPVSAEHKRNIDVLVDGIVERLAEKGIDLEIKEISPEESSSPNGFSCKR